MLTMPSQFDIEVGFHPLIAPSPYSKQLCTVVPYCTPLAASQSCFLFVFYSSRGSWLPYLLSTKRTAPVFKMHFTNFFHTLCLFLALLNIVTAIPQFNGGNNDDDDGNDGDNNNDDNNNNQNQGNNNNGGGGTTLDPENIQDASASDGDPDGGEGQAASLTDNANFINFCSGETKTNGLQVQGGSCNGIGKLYPLHAPSYLTFISHGANPRPGQHGLFYHRQPGSRRRSRRESNL